MQSIAPLRISGRPNNHSQYGQYRQAGQQQAGRQCHQYEGHQSHNQYEQSQDQRFNGYTQDEDDCSQCQQAHHQLPHQNQYTSHAQTIHPNQYHNKSKDQQQQELQEQKQQLEIKETQQKNVETISQLKKRLEDQEIYYNKQLEGKDKQLNETHNHFKNIQKNGSNSHQNYQQFIYEIVDEIDNTLLKHTDQCTQEDLLKYNQNGY